MPETHSHLASDIGRRMYTLEWKTHSRYE